MNPMHDTTLTIAQLAGGQIDHRHNSRAAQTLRERVELERALRRDQAQERRRRLIAGIAGTLRRAGDRLVGGRIGRAAREIGQNGLRPA